MWCASGRRYGGKKARAGLTRKRQVDNIGADTSILTGEEIRVGFDVALITEGDRDDIGLPERDRIAKGEIALRRGGGRRRGSRHGEPSGGSEPYYTGTRRGSSLFHGQD